MGNELNLDFSTVGFGLGATQNPLSLMPTVEFGQNYGPVPTLQGNYASPLAFSTNSLPQASMWDGIKQWGRDSGFLATKDANGLETQGWGGLALNTAQGLMNGFLGMRQYGLYKDQLNLQKKAFQKNWEAQRSTINSQLEDRQRARVASNASAYQSVGDYMAQNGIK